MLPLILQVAFQRESKGDYSAVVGRNSRAPLGDLTGKSLREVVRLMRSNAWIRDDGRRSTAVGGFQFTVTTLTDLIERRRAASWDDKFSPALQDKLALRLLQDRGWREGIEGSPALLRSLRLEWEAFKRLPDAVMKAIIESPTRPAPEYKVLLKWLT